MCTLESVIRFILTSSVIWLSNDNYRWHGPKVILPWKDNSHSELFCILDEFWYSSWLAQLYICRSRTGYASGLYWVLGDWNYLNLVLPKLLFCGNLFYIPWLAATHQQLFNDTLLKLNKELAYLQFELRACMNQYDGVVYYGVVNNIVDDESKLGTKYSVPQVAYYKGLVCDSLLCIVQFNLSLCMLCLLSYMLM